MFLLKDIYNYGGQKQMVCTFPFIVYFVNVKQQWMFLAFLVLSCLVDIDANRAFSRDVVLCESKSANRKLLIRCGKNFVCLSLIMKKIVY